MIVKVTGVTINGKNQAFGGYIHACDVEIGLAGKPTQIKVKFVNETGTYFEPELSESKPYKIQIGNIFTGNFYAITRTFEKGSRGKTLEVIFYDGSIKLDQIYVGLYKRMGDETTNIPGLVIVGREIHPCDTNDDGVFDGKDASNLFWQQFDPCELRCPTDPLLREPLLESCIQKEITEVFEVKYSFRDLINALQGTVTDLPEKSDVLYPVPADLAAEARYVSVTLPPSKVNKNQNLFNRIKIGSVPSELNDFYLNSYSGTLREVLRNWCADFGWTFYWENDTLNFLDTSVRPVIKDLTSSSIDSITDTKTLEGTVARGFVSRFSEPGIVATKDCSTSQAVLLRCLTLRDLFGNFYKPSWNAVAVTQNTLGTTSSGPLYPPIIEGGADNNNPNQIEYIDDVHPNGMDIANFEKSCVMAYHSDILRNLYNLWDYYGITSPDNAQLLKGKWLDRLGQMKIISVMHAGSTNLKYKYESLLHGNYPGFNKKPLSDEERTDFEQKGGYFVTVLRNKKQFGEVDLIDKQYKIEEHLATEFVGKHWFRAYVAPFYGETPQIFPNGQYLGALASNIKDIPFAQFNHAAKSTVGQMVSSFIQVQPNDYKQYGSLKFAHSYNENISNKLVRSIIYFQKESSNVWNPIKNAQTSINSLAQNLAPYMFRKIDISDLDNDTIRSLTIDESGQSTIKDELLSNVELYVFFPGHLGVSSGKITSSFTTNTFEENQMHLEDQAPFALSTAGLLDKKSVKYLVKGTPIIMPAGSSVQFAGQAAIESSFAWNGRDPSAKDFSTPAYKVFVTSNGKNRGVVAKAEAVFVEPPSVTGTLKTDFQVKELTRNATKFVNALTKTCSIDPQLLKNLHEKYAKNLNFSINAPFQSKKYRIYGVNIQSPVSIKTGLESINISIDGKDGVITEIGIGNSLITPISVDVVNRAIELNVDIRGINGRVNPI